MDERDDLIKSEGQFRNILENQEKPTVQEEKHSFDHLAVLNQTLKVIDVMKLDPFVKVVLRRKLVSPLMNGGVARSNKSIALELGATEMEVMQAEIYGVNEISRFLESAELQETINKHNRDITVEKAVKNMGNPN